MNIDYIFGDGEAYTYEADISAIKSQLVMLLCDAVKTKNNALYNDAGAYQMAMYVVYDLDMLDSLFENYEDKLYDLFYDKAYEEYRDKLENSLDEKDWHGTLKDVRGV